jgi:hypothetical protein
MKNIISIAGRIFSSDDNLTVINTNGRITVNGDLVENPAGDDGIVEIRIMEGSIHTVESDRNVVCGEVTGDVKAGGNVVAKDVGGSVKSGGNTTCGDVTGDVKAEGNIQSGRVSGKAKAGGNLIIKG